MTKEQALHNFWSSFGLTAYDENTVPDDATLPYITYQVSTGSYGSSIVMSAALWYRSQSWKDITAKAEEISNYIGLGGKVIKHDTGAIWVKQANTFAQRMNEGASTQQSIDRTIRRIILNIVVDFINI